MNNETLPKSNPFRLFHVQYGFYVVKHLTLRGIIACIYDGYITTFSPLTDIEKSQIAEAMKDHAIKAESLKNKNAQTDEKFKQANS